MTERPVDLWPCLEASWPAAATQDVGPFVVRQGLGGGQRVSATLWNGAPFTSDDLVHADNAARKFGQVPLYQIRNNQLDLNDALDARGFTISDPTILYAQRTEELAKDDNEAIFTWPPLAIQTELWAHAGIDDARLSVMSRAAEPKIVTLVRRKDTPCGTMFASLYGDCAMIHALEVVTELRRQGIGSAMVRSVAAWASRQGATWLALAVTETNTPANRLYRSLGMQIFGTYHYRKAPEAGV